MKTSKQGKSKKKTSKEPRPGKPCPECQTGILDYDGALNLVCPNCGYLAAGGCT